MDDSAFQFTVAKKFLQSRGFNFQLMPVHSAHEALNKIQEETFYAIIADYYMPEMDGLNLLKQLRAIDHDIPFIMITGEKNADLANSALNNGANYFLVKNTDPKSQYKELGERLIQLISHKRKVKQKLQENNKWSTELTTFCIQIPVICDFRYPYDKNIEQCEIS